jgi:hypothetical protein
MSLAIVHSRARGDPVRAHRRAGGEQFLVDGQRVEGAAAAAAVGHRPVVADPSARSEPLAERGVEAFGPRIADRREASAAGLLRDEPAHVLSQPGGGGTDGGKLQQRVQEQHGSDVKCVQSEYSTNC